MANAITIGRLILLFIVVAMIYFGNVQVITLCMLLLLVVIAADGVDGWVARKRNETSTFGAVFDIAGDRIVENTLWIVFSDLGLIPVWVPILVISRGFIVDGLRALSMQEGMTAFGEKNMMRSPLTTWLTAGRFMRGFFGYAKALAFVFLCGLEAWEHHDTTDTFLGSLYGMDWFRYLGWSLVWLAVALTVIRGIPVIIDGLAYVRELDARKRREAS
ncbi:MAG: CDP-alcohol phosphatidyltransferase family protein [Thermomicrobiales bacterium]|nr:CDP-alcohol phosphatidyltransferase family protein [Thermomicrobiales bacterium]